MKCLDRNKTAFFFLIFKVKESLTDEYGNESGEYKIVYSKPIYCRGNISPAAGSVQAKQFGTQLDYDKVIVLDDVCCPIDENSVLFIDKPPDFNEDGEPMFDYIVKRIARSKNYVSIAVSKVR